MEAQIISCDGFTGRQSLLVKRVKLNERLQLSFKTSLKLPLDAYMTECFASHMTMCAAIIKNLQTVSLSLSNNDFNVTNTL